jgi:16S rRNA G527 N7-methylase RsmG
MLLAQIESYVKQLLEWNETRSNLVAASQATRDQARTQTQH